MNLFDTILSNQSTEEDSEFMPLVSLDEGEESESLEPLPTTIPIAFQAAKYAKSKRAAYNGLWPAKYK